MIIFLLRIIVSFCGLDCDLLTLSLVYYNIFVWNCIVPNVGHNENGLLAGHFLDAVE